MRLAYWIYEGTAHHGIGRIANSLRGVQAVFHAPLGDDYINVVHTMLERTPDFPRSTTSVVTGKDLAQGNNRLPETLRQVEARFKPELIAVSASCSTTLLQEDLQTIIDKTELTTPTLLFEQNPFRVQENEAAENFFTHLVKQFAAKQEKTQKPSINFIGPASLGFHVRSDVIAMRRMMKTLGVQINVIAPYGAGTEELKRLPAAWLNVAPYRELGLDAATYLEQEFGMPSLLAMPMGVQGTLNWLESLIKMLNAEAEKLGRTERVSMPELTEFSLDGQSAPSGVPWFSHSADMESFSMKKAFVFGDATRTVALVKFLHDEIGMQITGAGT
jgi:light-independent protochlorophyllide reductase subunit B